MKNVWRSSIKTVAWSILLICNVNCSHTVEPTFTYESTLIFNSIQANLPVEFKREDENYWSFESGNNNAKIVIFKMSSNKTDIKLMSDTLNQFVFNNEPRDYDVQKINQIDSKDKTGLIMTFRKKRLISNDPPVTGFSYHIEGEIKMDPFLIKLKSVSNGFNLTPAILEIINSIKLIEESSSTTNDNRIISESKALDNEPSEITQEDDLKQVAEEIPEESPEIYSIDDNRVGNLWLGDIIPEKGNFGEFEVRADSKLFKGYDEDFVKMIFLFSKNNTDLFYATRDDESWKKRYENRVDEIHILSKKFRTDKGIGIGSTIEQFITAYPEYELMDAGGQFSIKVKNTNVQFFLSRSDYIGNKILDGPIDYILVEEMKPRSQITEVRIY